MLRHSKGTTVNESFEGPVIFLLFIVGAAANGTNQLQPPFSSSRRRPPVGRLPAVGGALGVPQLLPLEP